MATREHDPSLTPPASRVGLGALAALPPTLKPEEAFDLLGVGRTSGYELIRKGELPALRLGGKLLVLTAPLLRLIGADIADEQESLDAGSNPGWGDPDGDGR